MYHFHERNSNFTKTLLTESFNVPETVVTHRNRISRKAAAAIAAERNRQSSVDVLGGARDTDYLVDSDMMVVYNERTAL